jgi:hypothetical protein
VLDDAVLDDAVLDDAVLDDVTLAPPGHACPGAGVAPPARPGVEPFDAALGGTCQSMCSDSAENHCTSSAPACARLIRALESNLPGGFDVVGAWAWKPDKNEFIPDVMVHPRTSENLRFTGTPALVIEVLSTNRGDDLVLKLNRYAQAGLPHYWILDPKSRVLLAYGLEGDTFDLLTVVDEHEPREVGYGISAAHVDVPTLLP